MAELPLTADCARCAALCCVAPTFAVSADFAIDKPAGQPCPHLQPSSHCGIHSTLRERASRAARPTTASAPGNTSSRRRSPARIGALTRYWRA